MDAMDESDQMMVDADELTGLVAEEHRTEEKPTVTDVEPAGDAAVEDSGISPFILDVADPDACEEALVQAADAIADGECIVLPTDTVYGIGADALNPLAVQRLLNAKERGRDMPPPVLVSDSVALPALCQHIPAGAKALAEKYWPGGLTLILRAQESLGMDLGETNGTLAVRVPDQDQTRELLRMTGPMAVSSANKSGHPAALTAQEAADQLGVEVAVYLDAGPSRVGESSTIIDFVSTADGKVVRQGALSLEAIHEVASDVIGMESSVADQKSSEDHDPDAALPETELTQPEIEG
ncbi:threonylcarbamoyl-AMP synthase [Propionibacterium sp. NM47_B9-13]|jgi:L-threonylcarbamoyladenylate synthase|nr:L-threonylcarbamoyladenylate synthase [Cutibacterium modestum]TGY29192.1 threonylcarbamoyl-AMP synthase [Propionibacterium sp. NM47_B9-13]AOH45026.1 threonylcarbamoyl-AMP synthase [Cutibacterium modestum]EFS91287.1 Sua5/YciO/YrdC/YwlC family protein [Cutibacterium modestum HL044PA1]EGG27308.1 SUA5 related protein [Cutibacterium modestum P08]REB74667.1 threonylcarbamoyl-AMP synthase [Cutibacterium modestum]